MFRKGLSVLLCLLMALSIFTVIPFSASANEISIVDVGLESTDNSTFDAFINDPRWTHGVYWWGDYTGGKEPEISPWGSSGCGAYAADFAKYCFNSNSPRYGEEFHDVNQVRAGDVIHIGYNDNGHWLVVQKNGNSLYTAEGNYSSHVRIGWCYTVSGDRFAEDSRHFDVGYHFGSSPSPQISYTVNLNDGDYLKGISCPITGRVEIGGTYPWLHLYMDYATCIQRHLVQIPVPEGIGKPIA